MNLSFHALAWPCVAQAHFVCPASGHFGPVDKVGYFKIAAKKMTWKLRKEPLQEWDTSICLT